MRASVLARTSSGTTSVGHDGQRITDLMRQTGRQAADHGQALGADEVLLRFGKLMVRRRLRREPALALLAVVGELLVHGDDSAAELRQMATAHRRN